MRELFEKIAGLERKRVLLFAGIAVALMLVVIGGCRLLAAGGGEGSEGGGAEAEAVMLEEGEVEIRVAATVEAMRPDDTPTPVPTPDIAATLQAEMEANREKSVRIMKLSPLDSDDVRNPYLNKVEMAYMMNLGRGVWSYTKVWFLLRELVAEDVLDWSHLDVEYRLAEVDDYIGKNREDFRSRGSDSVGEVVGAYIDEVYKGMLALRESVNRLEDVSELLGQVESGLARDLELSEREELGRIVRELELGLEEFDAVMVRYGCSVCGELVRLRGR